MSHGDGKAAKTLLTLRSVALFSLLCVGTMLVIPFLDWHQHSPLTSFYHEWDAFALSSGALLLLLMPKSWESASLPRITLLPAGLVILVFLQLLLAGKLSFPCQALTYSLYMIWALLLMVAGRQLREVLGLSMIVTTLSWALLFGAEINALIVAIQYNGWHGFYSPFVLPTNGAMISGNIGQNTHIVLYLMMGIASLILLRLRGSLTLWKSVWLATPLLWSITVIIASVWPYPAEFQILLWQEILFHWQVAWLTFLDFPLTGAGFGLMGWQHFLQGPELQNPVPGALDHNVRNVLLQLAAESGLAGLLTVGAGLLYWLWGQRGASSSLSRNYCFALLGLLLFFSMFDDPFRYAYFLGLAALLLGMLDTAHIRFKLKRSGPLLMACMMALSLLVLIRVSAAYSDLASLYAPHSENISRQASSEAITHALDRLDAENILSHYGDVYVSSVPAFGIDNAEWRLALSQRAAHAVPERALVYRLAVLQAVTGDLEEAKMTMKQAIWAYPDQYEKVVRHALPWLVLQAPTQLNPLSRYARQMYEERQGLISRQ